MSSTIPIKASTLESVLKKFPARTPFKCSVQQSCSIVLNKIPILAWPTNYSNAYNLFQLSSFNDNGCKLPEPIYFWLSDRIHSQDSSVTLPDYFRHCLFLCVNNFCTTHLKCCYSCGNKYHSWFCSSKISDCMSGNHIFYSCRKLLRWLHEPDTSHHLLCKNIVRDWIISCPPQHFIAIS